jgi:glucokinase
MSRISFPFPLLVADVGGTNARFQLVEAPDASASPVVRRATAGHASFADAVRSLDLPVAPKSLIACGAGPAIGKRIALTNAAWELEGAQIASALGLSQGLLLNDFEAMALALTAIPEDWTRAIGPASPPEPQGTRLAVGPGTGLGVGAVVNVDGRWRAAPSEGGHIDLGPRGSEEEAIWAVMERVAGRITPESVLAGPGLMRLHRAREAVAGRACAVSEPADLTARALADRNGPEAASLRHAWRIVGRVAGDLALTLLPTGGVVICGGVAARIADFLDETEFRAAFEDKAPVAHAVAPIPTRLLLRDEAALEGMAAIGRAPEHYALDWRARLWL